MNTSASLMPGRSGIASVRSSGTLTNPGIVSARRTISPAGSVSVGHHSLTGGQCTMNR